MKIIYLIDIIVPLLAGVVCYLGSDNLILSGIVLIVFLLYFLLFFNRTIRQTENKKNRFHECYSFINNFIISLSVKNSIPGAFENATMNPSPSLKEELAGISHLDVMEQINYLKKYFTFHVYELFCDVLDVFMSQGGDILEMSRYLVKESRGIENYLNTCEMMNKRKVGELAILWVFTLAIIVLVRFGLSQFFNPVKDKVVYLVLLASFFLFLLFSIHMMCMNFSKIEIKGYRKYE